ncbi:MAG: hypothetical protein V4585_09145 [Bacteroidota bacterium]|jgi:hypothetical protein
MIIDNTDIPQIDKALKYFHKVKALSRQIAWEVMTDIEKSMKISLLST